MNGKINISIKLYIGDKTSVLAYYQNQRMLSILVSLLPTLKNFIIILAFSNKRTNFVYLLLEAKPTAKLPPKRDTVPFDETIKRNASHAHNFISGNVCFVTYAMTGFTWNHPALSKPLSLFLSFSFPSTRSTHGPRVFLSAVTAPCCTYRGHLPKVHVTRLRLIIFSLKSTLLT